MGAPGRRADAAAAAVGKSPVRDGNLTTFFLHGATFAAAFFVTQEFQLARGYSPLATGLRLLPFFATPMIISPLAGALSDRIGRRPIMLGGLALQAAGYVWVAARGSLHTGWIELDGALLVAGMGIPAAVTAGFRPALWTCATFAILAGLSGIAIAPSHREGAAVPAAAELSIPA